MLLMLIPLLRRAVGFAVGRETVVDAVVLLVVPWPDTEVLNGPSFLPTTADIDHAESSRKAVQEEPRLTYSWRGIIASLAK